jgi:hypothetical protein
LGLQAGAMVSAPSMAQPEQAMAMAPTKMMPFRITTFRG